MSGKEGTAEARKAFVDGCSAVKLSEVGRTFLSIRDCCSYLLPQIDHDFIFVVGKKLLDARKKVTEGVGKGMARLCTTYAH